MRQAISKVKAVVAKKDIIPLLTHYIVKGKRVFACNGTITASTPIDIEFDLCVKALDFQRFLDKTPGEIKVTEDPNNWIKVTSGRFRTKIAGMDPKLAPDWMPSTGKPVKLPVDFVAKLKSVRPFLSDNATQPWSAYACLRRGWLCATNNVVVVRAKVKGLDALDLMLSYEAIDYILAMDEPPTHLVTDEASLTFGWKDKTWLQQKNLSYKFPDMAITMLDKIPEPTWEIKEDWRESFLQFGDLVDGEIAMYGDRIIARQPTSEMEVEMECPVPEDTDHTSWNTRYVVPVLTAAQRVCVFMEGGPRLSFRNEHLQGLCTGMRK